MVFVLIHDDGPDSGLIHACQDYSKNVTLCGRRLHAASSTYTPQLFIVCSKCLAKLDNNQLQIQLERAKKYTNDILQAGRKCGLRLEVAVDVRGDDSASINFQFTKKKDCSKE